MAGNGRSSTVGEQLAILTERIEAQGALFADVKLQLGDISMAIKESERGRQDFRVQYTADMGAQAAHIVSVEKALTIHVADNQHRFSALNAELIKHVEEDRPKWSMVTAVVKRVDDIATVIGPLKWASILLGGAFALWGFDRVMELFAK